MFTWCSSKLPFGRFLDVPLAANFSINVHRPILPSNTHSSSLSYTGLAIAERNITFEMYLFSLQIILVSFHHLQCSNVSWPSWEWTIFHRHGQCFSSHWTLRFYHRHQRSTISNDQSSICQTMLVSISCSDYSMFLAVEHQIKWTSG